ncbi:MAG TPA: acyl-CoA dehydrogenase family protein [Mycobacteriales bacterium]
MTTTTARKDGVLTAYWPDPYRWLPAATLDAVEAGAEEADRAGRLNTEGLRALVAAGYPGMPVPADFSGRGASLAECCAVQAALAERDPALAIATNMHLFSVGIMVEQWNRRRDSSWFLLEAVASQNRLVASAFAEPNLGGNVLRSSFRGAAEPGGYRFTGSKTPCSLATVADLVCFQLETTDGELLVALLPMDAEGVSTALSWDALGMRGSGSDTVRFTDCLVPDELVFHRSRPGTADDEAVAAGVVWFCLTTTATYLGVFGRALAEATALLGRTRVHHLDARRADLPSTHQTVGDVLTEMLTVQAACLGLAGRMGEGGAPDALLPHAVAVKQRCADAVTAAVGRLAECVGGMAFSRRTPYERLWRDAQAARFHPPTPAAARQYLGRSGLGLPTGLDLDEVAPALRREVAP